MLRQINAAVLVCTVRAEMTVPLLLFQLTGSS